MPTGLAAPQWLLGEPSSSAPALDRPSHCQNSTAAKSSRTLWEGKWLMLDPSMVQACLEHLLRFLNIIRDHLAMGWNNCLKSPSSDLQLNSRGLNWWILKPFVGRQKIKITLKTLGKHNNTFKILNKELFKSQIFKCYIFLIKAIMIMFVKIYIELLFLYFEILSSQREPIYSHICLQYSSLDKVCIITYETESVTKKDLCVTALIFL